MNNFIFPLPETIELFGVTFLVNGVTLSIALIPLIVLALIIVYWRTQVSDYDAEHETALAHFVADGLQNGTMPAYQFDASPGIMTDWNVNDAHQNSYQWAGAFQEMAQGGNSGAAPTAYQTNGNWANGAPNSYNGTGTYVTHPSTYDVPYQMADVIVDSPGAPGMDDLTQPVKIPSFSNEALAYLEFENGGDELPSRFTLGADEFVRFGRQKSICEHVINDIRISRLHATILYTDGHFYLQDEGSSGGTYVNARKLDGTSQHQLKSGDTVHFNEVIYRFKLAE